MSRFRIAILIATIIFAFSLMGNHLVVAKEDQKLSAQERKLLASLSPKNMALFLQTVRKGGKILKRGGTYQEARATIQAPLKSLSQDISVPFEQLGRLAIDLMRDWDAERQILQEMLWLKKRLLQALQRYKAELEDALVWASNHKGRFAEVEFLDFTLAADGQVVPVPTPHAHADEETDESKFHAGITGRETHSIGAIRLELGETNAQIREVNETIRTIENELKQLTPLSN